MAATQTRSRLAPRPGKTRSPLPTRSNAAELGHHCFERQLRPDVALEITERGPDQLIAPRQPTRLFRRRCHDLAHLERQDLGQVLEQFGELRALELLLFSEL